MKPLIVLLIVFYALPSISHGQWVYLTSPAAADRQWNGVEFLNADTGFVTGLREFQFPPAFGGETYKTVDGGNTWSLVDQYNMVFQDIHFTGDIVGYSCVGHSGANGRIRKTIDGGQTWQENNVASGIGAYLMEFSFPSDSVGYCVGYDGIVLKTIDSGMNWQQSSVGTNTNLRSVVFTDEENGYAIGEYSNIFKTTDGGDSWTSYYPGTGKILLASCFPTRYTGYAVGGVGAIVKTEDAGLTWTLQQSGTTSFYQNVLFTDSLTGLAVAGYGDISYTTDGGTNWITSSVGNFSGSYGWYSVDTMGGDWVIAGYDGKIMRSSLVTGELTWTELDKKLNIYPNPSSGSVNIEGLQNAETILIYDPLGKLVYEKSVIGLSNHTIDLMSSKGVFILEVRTKNSYKRRKLLVTD